MASEVEEVTEVPKWMKELEAKREKRLKTKLGHEAGAGAPCLNCLDKCSGLDLHFWRKICKICKCGKESHDVPDDDVYNWAQFELLGCKPNKNRRKIVLPGKTDEVELEWLPQGNTETIDKYLKTVPANLLPIKGTQAAQERKQLLQKQLPIHDIDPLLCHELTADEMNQMNEYIAHVKQSSVGVGQLITIANLLKGEQNYIKDAAVSELVKLEECRQPTNLASHLQQLELNNTVKPKKDLMNLQPENVFQVENVRNPIKSDLMRDLNYKNYAREENHNNANVQCSQNLAKNVKDLMYSTFDNNVPLNNNLQKEATNNTPTENTKQCHHCKKTFKNDEFAIILDRTCALYHPDCFKCHGCNQILADNMYFYDKESNHIYCGRDYAKIRGIPRCGACDELIFTKEYCLAQQATFHLKHFSCFYCDKQLAGENYLIEDANPLCLPCFETQKADVCMTCHKIIKPDQQGLTLKEGKHFHVDDACFACSVCKICLFDKKLLFRNDKLYCSYDCFNVK